MAQQWPPKRATAFTVVFPIRDGTGAPVTGVAGLDSERSIDGAAFADCTNEATEIGTTGFYSLTLSTTDMNGDYITVQVKSTSYPTVGFFISTVGSTWDELDNLVDDLESRLGTPSNLGSGATVAANLVDIEAQTDDIGAAGAGLTAVPWNAAWDAEVQSEVDDALLARNLDKLVVASGTSDSGTTTTMVDAARTEADTDYWKGDIILFTSGNITGQARLITAFDPATDTVTFSPATTQAVATQNYVIIPAGRADLGLWLGVAVNALVSGRVDASVGAMAANVITAAATAADFLAEVNAEVADVMKTDTTTEPAQAAPTATPTMQEILTYLYVGLRNRVDVDTVAGSKEFYNDAGTVIFKKAMTDAGGIYSEAEAVSGP